MLTLGPKDSASEEPVCVVQLWFPVSPVLQNLLDELASREQEVQKVYADSQQYQQAVKVSHEPCQSTQ
jgi:hypothetical protein